MASNAYFAPPCRSVQDDILDTLRQLGLAPTSPFLADHTKIVSEDMITGDLIVMVSNLRETSRVIFDVPAGFGEALHRGEPAAYDRIQSVINAPFN